MKLEKAFGPWYGLFKPLFTTDMFYGIGNSLMEQQSKGVQILPGLDDTFCAFTACPPQELKVVVVNPAPYSEPGLADGLAWSTRSHILPMAQFHLQLALQQAAGVTSPERPTPQDLSWLAAQGVLLLNAAFTCEPNHSLAHFRLWEPFMSAALRTLSDNFRNIIFILVGDIGSYFATNIDETRNTIITCQTLARAHSQENAWDHHHVFSRANKLLTHFGKEPISWIKQSVAVHA